MQPRNCCVLHKDPDITLNTTLQLRGLSELRATSLFSDCNSRTCHDDTIFVFGVR